MRRNAKIPWLRLRCWWLAGAALIALLVVGILLLYPPLVTSSEFTARYAVRGHPAADAEAFHPVFKRHLVYVRLPVAADTRYLWFLVDLRRKVVSLPLGPYRSSHGFDYIHADQAFGVRLTDAKVEDHWTVSFETGVITFTNGSIQVTVTHRGA